jgi:hypothetical protein
MSLSAADHSRHEIFVDNLILGKSQLFTISLPPGWQLAPGVSRPEVSAIHTRRGKKWVANGDAWYVIFNSENKWALEMAAKIRSPKNPAASVPVAGQPSSVGGHLSQVEWQEKRRGLPWNRHDVTFMILDFFCDLTDRRFVLEFSGWCPPEGFQAILQSLKFFRCH